MNDEYSLISINLLSPKDMLKVLLSVGKVIQNRRIKTKAKIRNLKAFSANRDGGLATVFKTGYRYSFSTMTGIEFEGHFGDNPTVIVIFSKTDEFLNLKDRVQIEKDNLKVIKLNKLSFDGTRYRYNFAQEYIYVSNSRIVFKPFVVVIFDEKSLGFATILTLDYPMAESCSQFEGGASFKVTFENVNNSTKMESFSWPKKNNLLITKEVEGRKYKLSDEEIDAIMKIKKEFIKGMNSETAYALKDM